MGARSGMYGGWANVSHLKFSRSAVVTCAEWGRALTWSRHTRRVTTFPSFVLNGSSKPCQGITICSGINCCARRHEVDQENAYSVAENGRHDFFTEIEVLNFWFWGNAYGAIAVTVAWAQEGDEKTMFHLQSKWSPEILLLPARSA